MVPPHRPPLFCFLTALILMGVVGAPALADDAENPFTRDLKIISQWFEGEFDNSEQLWFHQRSRAEGDPPVRIHATHQRLSDSPFGDYAFYVEEYRDNDPAQLYRQRLVTFQADLAAGAIRVKQGFFKDANAVRGGVGATSELTGVTVEDVSFIDECDVFLRREADQFKGEMKAKACVFGDGDERRYAVHQWVLSETKFWRVDATYLKSNDEFFRGTKPGTSTEMRRAQSFDCDVYFYADGEAPQVVEDLRLHNQGGIASAVRARDQQAFDVLLRAKEYPYYGSRPDFMYYSIRRSGEDRSIAFGVADAQSRQFGLNQGDLAVFCHRDGYEFREPLEQL